MEENNLNSEIRPVEKMPRWEGVDNELANQFLDEWNIIYRKFQKEAEDLLDRAKSCNAKLVLVSDRPRPLRDICIHFAPPHQ